MRDPIPIENYQKDMRAHAGLVRRWRAIQRRPGRIAVYGAGKYTARLLVVIENEDLRKPDEIWDDTPRADSLSGIPVVKTPETYSAGMGTVVLGTDTFQVSMRRKLSSVKGRKPRIVDVSGADTGEELRAIFDSIRRKAAWKLANFISPSRNFLLDQLLEAHRDPGIGRQLALLYEVMGRHAAMNKDVLSTAVVPEPATPVQVVASAVPVLPAGFPRALDLGCGNSKTPGAVGVDVAELEGVDVVADIGRGALPFADSSFDVVHMNDIVEHLPDTIGIMEEVHRVTRSNARIFVRVVNWNSSFTADDPTHKRAFTEKTFDFFGSYPGREYYTRARFDVVRVTKHYSRGAQRLTRNERLLAFLGRHFCNVLEGMTFELRTVKEGPVSTAGGNIKLSEILRCPCCVRKGDGTGNRGILKPAGETDLVCSEPACGLRYHVQNGKPVMTNAAGTDLETGKSLTG